MNLTVFAAVTKVENAMTSKRPVIEAVFIVKEVVKKRE
jgi:hypothetical protein